MKKYIILLLISVFGIIFTQLLGVFLISANLSNTVMLVSAIVSLLLKIGFFGVGVYTLVATFKHKGGWAVKTFKALNWIYVILVSLITLVVVISIINMAIKAKNYYNTSALEVIPPTAIQAKINPLIDYNGLPKDFILGLRFGNIDSNFIKMMNYSPKKEVWEKMEDKGAWFSLEKSVCFDNNKDCRTKAKGLSALSRQINNPILLVAPVMIATYHLDEKLPVCSDEGLKLVPKSVYLDVVNSKIIVLYKGTKALTKCKYLQLSGLNARDFGLEWAKVYKKQNIYFPYPNNISKKLYKFNDSIVVGNFCKDAKHETRCNVLSPVDDKLVFNITSYPANIELKLWKNKPLFTFNDSDFLFEIRFVE